MNPEAIQAHQEFMAMANDQVNRWSLVFERSMCGQEESFEVIVPVRHCKCGFAFTDEGRDKVVAAAWERCPKKGSIPSAPTI